MQASGSYLIVIDESFTSSAQVSGSCIVFMQTLKGNPINDVTADNFQDVLGFNPDFNAQYLGLQLLLNTVSIVRVVRLSHNAYYGNSVVAKDGTITNDSSVAGLVAFEGAHAGTEDTAALLIAMATPGNWGTVTFGLDKPIKAAVASGSIVSTGVHAYTVSDGGYGYTVPPQVVITDPTGAGSGALASANISNGQVTTIDVVNEGTDYAEVAVSFVGGLPASIGSRAFYPYLQTNGANILQGTGPTFVQFDLTAADFVPTVTINDASGIPFLTLMLMRAFTTPGSVQIGITTPVALDDADNGSTPSASDIDFSVLKGDKNTFICSNGTLDSGIVNAIINYVGTHGKFFVGDTMNTSSSVAGVNFKARFTSSEFSTYMHVWDNVVYNGKSYAIAPSVYKMIAFSNLITNTGYPCEPTAGYLRGTVSPTNLTTSDVDLYADFLKTNKLNYLTNRGKGPVIWELRTNYALESDLSYESSVLTLLVVSQQTQSFFDNFSFRFIGQTELDLMNSGLEDIKLQYTQLGYIWSFAWTLPTIAQAMATGVRNMNIPVKVKFAEEGEVFTIRFYVQKSAVTA